MSAATIEQFNLPDEATVAAVLTGQAYYLYAVGRPRPGAPAEGEPIRGVDPRSPVRTIARGPLVALLSEVSLAEFDLAVLEERLQSRPWLEMLAIGHQRVMSALLERYTMLPLKLCTLYTDAGRIDELLERSGAQFTAALDRLEGASEWGVKLYCDRAALASWAERGAPQLRQLAASVEGASAGARYMLEKRLKRAGQQLAEELMRGETQTIALRLAELARAAQRNQPQPATIHGRAEEMTLNGAYLVDDDGLERFMAELEALREQYGSRGFTLELTGPWPAYSFSGDASTEGA